MPWPAGTSRHRLQRPVTIVLVALAALTGCTSDDEDTVSIRAVATAPFDQAPETVPAGTVTLELVNEDEIGHSLRIEELDDGIDVVAGGERGTTTLTFEAGETYTYYCDVAGHRDVGMEGQFVADS